MDIRGFKQILRSRAAAAAVLAQLTPAVVQQFEIYYQLLAKWNRSINLTSLPLEPLAAEGLDRLLIEPLLAAEHLRHWLDAKGLHQNRWVDVGSGGGSPAIPLRLVRPQGTLVLVESKARKAAFLRELVRELALERTEVATERFEVLTRRHRPVERADLVTIRAVRLDEQLALAVHDSLVSSGVLLVFASDTAQPETPNGFELAQQVGLTASTSRLFAFRRTDSVPRGTLQTG